MLRTRKAYRSTGRFAMLLAVLATLLWPLLLPATSSSAESGTDSRLPDGSPTAALDNEQDFTAQASLETVRPSVQWSPAGSQEWQAVPTRQAVRAGDRV